MLVLNIVYYNNFSLCIFYLVLFPQVCSKLDYNYAAPNGQI